MVRLRQQTRGSEDATRAPHYGLSQLRRQIRLHYTRTGQGFGMPCTGNLKPMELIRMQNLIGRESLRNHAVVYSHRSVHAA
jgi:hypothetical protein